MTAPIREPGKEEQAVPDAPEQRAMRRSAARLAAVQALYQIEITNGVTAAVVDEFRAHRQGGVLEDALAKADFKKFEAIVTGVDAHRQELDALIAASLAKDWSLKRLGSVLRAILRSAAFELLAGKDVPAKVVINEYVDLTHAFFEGNEPGFVNGMLDRLAHQLRESEMQKANREQPAPPE
ncbi:MAG: transcription antitermination factor NusB [Alphaproteobacteria bacterium]